ncbi:hypothetical protein LSH36_717g01002, partial [Paralvinella palmiformis]
NRVESTCTLAPFSVCLGMGAESHIALRLYFLDTLLVPDNEPGTGFCLD